MKTVRALVFKQKDVNLYCFTMNAVDLEPLCYVEAAHATGKKAFNGSLRSRDYAKLENSLRRVKTASCQTISFSI